MYRFEQLYAAFRGKLRETWAVSDAVQARWFPPLAKGNKGPKPWFSFGPLLAARDMPAHIVGRSRELTQSVTLQSIIHSAPPGGCTLCGRG